MDGKSGGGGVGVGSVMGHVGGLCLTEIVFELWQKQSDIINSEIGFHCAQNKYRFFGTEEYKHILSDGSQ